jgi:H-type lectin domain
LLLSSNTPRLIFEYLEKNVGFRAAILLALCWTTISVLTTAFERYVGIWGQASGPSTLRGYRFETGEISLSRTELEAERKDWLLDHLGLPNVDPEKAGNDRPFRHHILFHTKFSEPPHLILVIKHFDLSVVSNIRLTTIAENVQENEFDLLIKTWNKSIVHQVAVEWIAIGRPAFKPLPLADH